MILHERLSKWSAQVRPRVVSWPVRLKETRSLDELTAAASGHVCPIVIIAGSGALGQTLESVAEARRASAGAMILVVDAPDSAEFLLVAIELGASHVLARPVLPPQIMTWLERWVALAQLRTEASGWSLDRAPEPEPWEALILGDPAFYSTIQALS